MSLLWGSSPRQLHVLNIPNRENRSGKKKIKIFFKISLKCESPSACLGKDGSFVWVGCQLCGVFRGGKVSEQKNRKMWKGDIFRTKGKSSPETPQIQN